MSGHEGEILLEDPVNRSAPPGLGVLTAKYVRYPGSQQLVLWLPQDGHAGYRSFRILGPAGDPVEEVEMANRLNGRVQILIDTYPWPPGSYLVTITHQEGWRHELRLRKLAEGEALPKPPPPPEPEPSKGPIVYRDGAGHILPNLDLEMRARALEKLAARFSRRLEFEGNYRAGTIIYVEGDIRVKFYHEMCGGGVHFSIDVPVAAKWEAETGRPLSERDDIIEFVAAETQRRQARSWRYEIKDNRIDFVD
ncbi:MAG TPA: hypothetical protein PKV67_08685 [Hyphomonas sp.]|nr:hypothetical protein [Hyphomonas sp.]HRJ00841.1 hypothetical protein [Hyphomonas sp.]HRK66831.1 hypothetical protein [Hyphomonas sp.]